MKNSKQIQNILSNYSSEPPAILSNLYKFLTSGCLTGTGKMVILPVDQGFEHGPDRSFAINPESLDPLYHFSLAIEAKLSAIAAPYGFLSLGADKFAGQIPMILKLNSNNLLNPNSLKEPDQALTSSVKDAVYLGCSAVGLTIYPGSFRANSMIEEVKDIICEARSFGLPTIIWSYPRGGELSKEGQTALDVTSYAAHIACLLGAHIVKVKPPMDIFEQKDTKEIILNSDRDFKDLSERISHIMKSSFSGKRLVVFSGGAAKSDDDILEEIRQIKKGGGSGSIIGRNSFQRPKNEALYLLKKICDIYCED